MSELTKEYFEQHLAATIAPLATKQDIRDAVDELARITNSGFEDIGQRLDITERVNKIETTLERKFTRLEEVLHLKL
jgi:hypothetical protein